jgi:hypothetical protein
MSVVEVIIKAKTKGRLLETIDSKCMERKHTYWNQMCTSTLSQKIRTREIKLAKLMCSV